jgi:hypothetical protein
MMLVTQAAEVFKIEVRLVADWLLKVRFECCDE